jgi:hypothetical protein
MARKPRSFAGKADAFFRDRALHKQSYKHERKRQYGDHPEAVEIGERGALLLAHALPGGETVAALPADIREAIAADGFCPFRRGDRPAKRPDPADAPARNPATPQPAPRNEPILPPDISIPPPAPPRENGGG